MNALKVEEFSFRNIYQQICLLTSRELVKDVDLYSVFEFPPDEKLDGFLTYAHIDGGTFSFEILAGAQLNGKRVKIFPASYKKSVNLKRSQVDDIELKIMTAEYPVAFRDRIQMINDRSNVDAARKKTRLIKTLDAFRHPYYPDDVLVYFIDGTHESEILWVRCLSVNKNILIGELLNDPRNDFGCHAGDKIIFGIAQINGKNILLNLSKTEASRA